MWAVGADCGCCRFNVNFRAAGQGATVHSKHDADGRVQRGVAVSFAGCDRGYYYDRGAAAILLWMLGSADLGDDGRRCRLWGVEDGTARDGNGDSRSRVCVMGWIGAGRRAGGLAVLVLRLRFECGADAAGTGWNSDDLKRVVGIGVLCGSGLFVLLPDFAAD